MFGFNSEVEEQREEELRLLKIAVVVRKSERDSYRRKVEELESKLKDLQFQKDTLETLLKGLRIAVTLPVRVR